MVDKETFFYMISIYSTGFNLVSNGFSYERSIQRFLAVGNEVVIAVNTSEDDTLNLLKQIAKREKRLNIVEVDIPYSDITLDGRLKDIALQATTQPIKIQLDMDEAIPESARNRWIQYGRHLLAQTQVDCFMVPTIDLWGSPEMIRADKDVGVKFRLHKAGLKRGVWRRAWKAGGHIDTSMSDSTELLSQDDELVRAAAVAPPHCLKPENVHMLSEGIYTIHEGYLSFDQRIRVNQAFWKERWPMYSGHEENVATDRKELEVVKTCRHGLALS